MAALRSRYQAQVATALENDGWGQVIEASENYELLMRSMNKEKGDHTHSSADRALLEKLAITFKLRIDALNDPTGRGITLASVRATKELIATLFTPNPAPFTIDLSPYSVGAAASSLGETVKPTDSVVTHIDDRGGLSTHESAQGGSLKPPPPPFDNGDTRVTLHIDRIGLKNATQYLEPFITVSVASESGRMIEEEQDTPISTDKKELSVMFGLDVHMQTALEKVPDNAAVFFEFKHFKPKKDKVSTRCFAFLDKKDIKPGVVKLDIWKKPLDHRRKKLKKLSVKPLHLHLRISTIEG